MSRTLLLAAALGVMALPAAAETSIKVDLTGLDAKAAHIVIVRAAQAACRVEMRDDTSMVLFYERPNCISEAVHRTEATLAAAGSTHLASR